MAYQILRPAEAMRRLGIKKTNFWRGFVATGRLRLVRLGPRSVGVLEHELNALIEAMPRVNPPRSIRQKRTGKDATADA